MNTKADKWGNSLMVLSALLSGEYRGDGMLNERLSDWRQVSNGYFH